LALNKLSYKKCDHEIDPWCQFIQHFAHSFYVRISQKRKKSSSHYGPFALLGSALVKALRKLLMKLTPDLPEMLLKDQRIEKDPLIRIGYVQIRDFQKVLYYQKANFKTSPLLKRVDFI